MKVFDKDKYDLPEVRQPVAQNPFFLYPGQLHGSPSPTTE